MHVNNRSTPKEVSPTGRFPTSGRGVDVIKVSNVELQKKRLSTCSTGFESSSPEDSALVGDTGSAKWATAARVFPRFDFELCDEKKLVDAVSAEKDGRRKVPADKPAGTTTAPLSSDNRLSPAAPEAERRHEAAEPRG